MTCIAVELCMVDCIGKIALCTFAADFAVDELCVHLNEYAVFNIIIDGTVCIFRLISCTAKQRENYLSVLFFYEKVYVSHNSEFGHGIIFSDFASLKKNMLYAVFAQQGVDFIYYRLLLIVAHNAVVKIIFKCFVCVCVILQYGIVSQHTVSNCREIMAASFGIQSVSVKVAVDIAVLFVIKTVKALQ